MGRLPFASPRVSGQRLVAFLLVVALQIALRKEQARHAQGHWRLNIQQADLSRFAEG